MLLKRERVDDLKHSCLLREETDAVLVVVAPPGPRHIAGPVGLRGGRRDVYEAAVRRVWQRAPADWVDVCSRLSMRKRYYFATESITLKKFLL